MNRAIGLERQSEIDALARHALQVGKQSRNRMGILPNVATRAFAATDSFPAVETPVAQTVAGGRCQNRGVQKCAVQKPEGQGGVVPGPVPQPRRLTQPLKMFSDMLTDRPCGTESRSVKTPRRQTVQPQIWQAPGEQKRNFCLRGCREL